ncbi:MAG: DUF3025 domain-containing protein [Gammaproteobacteria bacterium]
MNEPRAIPWQQVIDRTLRCWEDYEEVLNKLFALSTANVTLPDTMALQSLLNSSVTNAQRKPIQFVNPSQLPAGNYEEEIFNTGRVSTRTDNWHDFFNALVWSRFPALKAAMNAIHFAELQKQSGNGRGKLRDALTLWDECGVIVASSSDQLLEELACRNWKGAFQDLSPAWRDHVRVFICGHALLEKYLSPYKSITAHAVLVKLDSACFTTDRSDLRKTLDESLALQLQRESLIKTTADLSPLPLAGIPGWWKEGEQDDVFYADKSVFRIPAVPISSAPIFNSDLR